MSLIATILKQHEAEILNEWLRDMGESTRRTDLISDAALKEQAKRFLRLFQEAAQGNNLADVNGPHWSAVRDMLTDISGSRAQQGFSPGETAMFVFSLKKPLFAQLRRNLAKDTDGLADETWAVTQLLDKLGLYTTEVYQRTRNEIIVRQQQEMLELSTPVIKLWEGILAVPLIGTLDSARTQVVMEALLQQIVSTGSGVAIIDITGVPTVDTLTAQHLLKTVTAARLMGADCIISGIRPQIAQTIVHLGVALGEVVTKASLADAFAQALKRTGQTVVKLGGQ